jgi:hypothetical protein
MTFRFSNTLHFVCGLCMFCFVHADDIDTLWSMTYGGVEFDVGMSLQQTSDSGYIVAGLTHSFGAGRFDVYAVKIDVNGAAEWEQTYGGPHGDAGDAVLQTADGEYLIAGITYPSEDEQTFYLVKSSSSGRELFTTKYQFGSNVAHVVALMHGNDDKYIMIVQSSGVYIMAIDTLGSLIWAKRCEYIYMSVEDAQKTEDRGYVMCGWTCSHNSAKTDYVLAKLDSTGVQEWKKTYGGDGYEYCKALYQTDDDGYVLVGSTDSYGSGGADVYLIKTNALGDILWTQTYGGVNDDFGQDIVQTADGGYVIVGATKSFGSGDADLYVIKTDSNGHVLYTKTYGGDHSDSGYHICVIQKGVFVIMGSTLSYGNGKGDIWILKLSTIAESEEGY